MKCKRMFAIVALSTAFSGQARAAVPRVASAPLWETIPDVSPLPMPDRHGVATVNGAELYYAVFHARAGRPVILLHGGFGSADAWGDEVPRLARDREVIVFDTRGHGHSSLGSVPLTYELFASDALALMDILKVRRASIVGWSDGGITGLLLAIHHPERVAALLAYGANFNNNFKPPPGRPTHAMFVRYMAGVKAVYRRESPTPEGFPKLYEALKKLYESEPNIPPTDLAKIGAPTVIADGQYEQFIPLSHTKRMASLIPGARLAIMPNVSHGGPTQDPNAFHRLVVSLVGR